MQTALFEPIEVSTVRRELQELGEQKDIRYFSGAPRSILNGPGATGMGFWSINHMSGVRSGARTAMPGMRIAIPWSAWQTPRRLTASAHCRRMTCQHGLPSSGASWSSGKGRPCCVARLLVEIPFAHSRGNAL